ncbi:MAG TPA: DUF4340 domain-containing protein [Deltaproteobacteria bacterium]|nr:DUF4340 domain-containing protein [Deltaproteobacteria bacterium]HPJ94138.1 DUF4340 domain-containing protein [Deltaproteobacteria bacterium]
MRLKTLLISLGILVILAGYYYYFELYQPMAEQAEKEKARQIFTLDTSDIEQISIYGANTISLSKKDSRWWITTPIEKPADSSAVESLLFTLAGLRTQRSLGEVSSLRDLGLDPPELSLVFKTKEAEFFLNIGGQTPTKNYCYAGSSTRDDIFLINAYEKSGVDKDLFTLRDKHLFSLPYADIQRITIKRHALILEFLRNSDGLWHLFGDEARKVKTSKMNEFLGTLCRLEAQAYTSESQAPGEPDITIELASDGSAEALRIWQMPRGEEDIYAFSAVQDCMVTIRNSLLLLIPNDVMDVTDRSLLSIDERAVTKITLLDGKEQTFSRKEDAWYRGDRRVHESHLIDAFIETLNMLEYEEEYMQVLKDAQRERSVQIFYQDASPVFDIVLYSQYYIGLGDRYYQINKGGMKTLHNALDMLLNKGEG